MKAENNPAIEIRVMDRQKLIDKWITTYVTMNPAMMEALNKDLDMLLSYEGVELEPVKDEEISRVLDEGLDMVSGSIHYAPGGGKPLVALMHDTAKVYLTKWIKEKLTIKVFSGSASVSIVLPEITKEQLCAAADQHKLFQGGKTISFKAGFKFAEAFFTGKIKF